DALLVVLRHGVFSSVGGPARARRAPVPDIHASAPCVLSSRPASRVVTVTPTRLLSRRPSWPWPSGCGAHTRSRSSAGMSVENGPAVVSTWHRLPLNGSQAQLLVGKRCHTLPPSDVLDPHADGGYARRCPQHERRREPRSRE